MFMRLPFFGIVHKASMGAGVAVTGLAVLFGRRILVATVRTGYRVTDAAGDAWHQAQAEAASINTEAKARRAAGTDAQLQQLRDEVAALRASLASAATP